MSIWDDVAFDGGSATTAAGELRDAAVRLEELGERRAALAARAQVDWTGDQRNRFDQRLQLLQDGTAMLAADLLAAASEIEAELAAAHREHRRRVELREEWRARREVERVAREMR